MKESDGVVVEAVFRKVQVYPKFASDFVEFMGCGPRGCIGGGMELPCGRGVQEKDEYVENIIADVGALGLRYEKLSYTSDYFPEMLDLAERLIKAGHLYADDTPVEQMREAWPRFRSPAFCTNPHRMCCRGQSGQILLFGDLDAIL